MTVNLSFLPALAAVFMLMFARLGTMVMLMPGLGEQGIPARIRLVVALVLVLVMLPLHRAEYSVDITQNFAPLVGLLVQEVIAARAKPKEPVDVSGRAGALDDQLECIWCEPGRVRDQRRLEQA